MPDIILRNHIILLFAICTLTLGCQDETSAPSAESNSVPSRPVVGKNGMVSTAHPLASQVGVDILKAGGNAFDAATAVHFALAVVYPRAGNLGGGGFAVYRDENGDVGSLDFREKAPMSASRDMYLGEDGEPDARLSREGALAVGVPGSVDGILALHERFGALPLEEVMAPAIELARRGFTLTQAEADVLNRYQEDFLRVNGPQMPFFKESGWSMGDSLSLPQLANTLETIAKDGRQGFYQGSIAAAIRDAMQGQGGLVTQSDLDAYHSVWRIPVTARYRGYDVISMPPPSSGGVALMQLLAGTWPHDIDSMGHNTAATVHLMTELERRVYADRATHLGDPDFYPVHVGKLLDSIYLAERYSSINMEAKTPSTEVKEGHVEIIESMETTHYSIVDSSGNAVAITTTLNSNFGSKLFVQEGGFFLNNEMDDFSAKPGVPNQFGLLGGEANAIEPQKRMLSSMTPTILLKDGEVFMVVGTPGGSTIITSVYQTILNVVDHGMNIQEAIEAGKFHHQWQPDVIMYETGSLSGETIRTLEGMGHVLEEVPSLGRVDAVIRDTDGSLQGGADPRGDDKAIGF